MRDLIQRGLLATNPHWPFSLINRAPYRLALVVVGQRLGRLRGVSGVHLRNGLTRPDWVPGLSDIDLTVVIDDLTAADDAALTLGIWTEYGRLKRVFPMLGELAILPQRALGAWSRFGITGHEMDAWIAVAGPRVGPMDYRADPLRVRLDAANHALLFFTDVLVPRYVDGTWRRPVGRHAVVRVADKVRRYARQAAAADVDVSTRTPEHPGAAVARALLALDAAVRTADFDAVWAGAAAGVAPADAGRVPSGEPADVPGIEHLLSSVMRVHGTTIAVVRAGLAEDQVEACIERLSEHLGACRRLLVVTPAVFEHLLRFQDPFLYTALQSSGEAIVGGDASLPRPPHVHAFDHAVLVQVQNVLAAARSHDVFRDDPAPVRAGDVALAVNRAIAIKGWLRTGTVPRSYAALVNRNACVDGTSLSRLAEITNRGGICADASGLLRDLADEMASDIVERGADRRILRAVAGGVSQVDGAVPE